MSKEIILNLRESNFDQARVYNEQLNRPMDKSSRRGQYLKCGEGGYKAIADDYYKSNKKMIMMARIKVCSRVD